MKKIDRKKKSIGRGPFIICSNLSESGKGGRLHAWHVLLIYARASKVNTKGNYRAGRSTGIVRKISSPCFGLGPVSRMPPRGSLRGWAALQLLTTAREDCVNSRGLAKWIWYGLRKSTKIMLFLFFSFLSFRSDEILFDAREDRYRDLRGWGGPV